MRALIFTGGECHGTCRLPEYDISIAADSGYATAKRHGVEPLLLVGDFDSIGAMPDRVGEVIRHPVMKDETDTVLAAREAVRRGATELYIIGGTGGRADHALSNMLLVRALSFEGIRVTLTDGESVITHIKAGESADVPAGGYRYFSIITASTCRVTVTGALYPLKEETLTADVPSYGVSNEPLGDGAQVTCLAGECYVIRSERL